MKLSDYLKLSSENTTSSDVVDALIKSIVAKEAISAKLTKEQTQLFLSNVIEVVKDDYEDSDVTKCSKSDVYEIMDASGISAFDYQDVQTED